MKSASHYLGGTFCVFSFDPPGQMSAGLTCEMLVTFKPMVSIQF